MKCEVCNKHKVKADWQQCMMHGRIWSLCGYCARLDAWQLEDKILGTSRRRKSLPKGTPKPSLCNYCGDYPNQNEGRHSLECLGILDRQRREYEHRDREWEDKYIKKHSGIILDDLKYELYWLSKV